MGHVFVDFEWETVCLGFCQIAGLSLDKLRARFSEVAKLGYESGRISTDDFLAEINSRLTTKITRSQFEQLWTATFRENCQMAELMQRLKAQRPLYLLSNTNEIHYNFLQSKFDVARHFEELILSYEVGCSKPDAAIYEEVLRRSGLPAEQHLFIDDLGCNVEAAEKVGMRTIQFKGVESLRSDLTAYGFTV
jgi:putative hydrolase of the HAD superfamily